MMRLATITNWAYGITVSLTVLSASTMLLASSALDRERDTVEQQHELGKATANVEDDVLLLSDEAREYLDTGDPTYLALYDHEKANLGTIDQRVQRLAPSGVSGNELNVLRQAIRTADMLHDEQAEAIAAFRKGDERRARQILFGPEYERQLDQVNFLDSRFIDGVDRRLEADVRSAASIARLWRAISEIALAITGLVFLCVLYFVFKRRVVRPVVKLSDVVKRLAEQDYAVEPPQLSQIDEIGDMAQAIATFRENGLERQRLEQERSADRAVRDLLSNMTQRLQSCDTLGDLLEVVWRFIPEIAPTNAGRLYLFDPARNAMVEACAWLSPQHSANEFAPAACWGLRRGTPHRAAGESIDVPCAHLRLAAGDVLVETICLPLISHQETVGLLYLERREAHTAERTPMIYLGLLAENVGLALVNLRLRERLQEMAMKDPLTGLANRRRLERKLEELTADAKRRDQPLSCLLLDVDHFKRFNDVFGHEAGDAVLRQVGEILQSATREPELAFRYGGEEFLLLLVGSGPEQALERAEEIRRRIAALELSHGGRDLGRITASFGVASMPDACGFDGLIGSADAALYCAKEDGRDRVKLAASRREARTAEADAA